MDRDNFTEVFGRKKILGKSDLICKIGRKQYWTMHDIFTEQFLVYLRFQVTDAKKNCHLIAHVICFVIFPNKGIKHKHDVELFSDKLQWKALGMTSSHINLEVSFNLLMSSGV